MRPLTTSSEQEMEQYNETWDDEPLTVVPVCNVWVRLALVKVALGMMLVFGIAIWLNPYKGSGEARNMETHMQLGLPECGFKKFTDLPCPSCGMTTSFSLLIRGDLIHSMQANFVGTLLATACLLYIPWAFVSAWRARPLFITSIQDWLCRLILVLVALLIIRWGVVIAAMLSAPSM